VDKIQFNSVLKRFTATTQREAEEILSLKSQYPYSQLLTALAARVAKDHNFTIQNNELTIAAVYAADRTVLKDVITYQPVDEVAVSSEGEKDEVIEADNDSKVGEKAVLQDIEEAKIPVAESKSPITPVHTTNEKIEEKPFAEKSSVKLPVEKIIRYDIDSDDVAGQVMKDLEKLSQLKHNFEMLLTDYADTSNRSEKVTSKKAEPLASPVIRESAEEIKPGKEEKKKAPPVRSENKESLRVRRERMIAHAKSLQSQASDTSDETKLGDHPKKHGVTDEIIDDIKKNKAEIEPESEKQKQQINIINHFIKTQPSISSARDRSGQSTGDLSPIKTGEFGDNIISETLVEILIKQGKKDKAIEVLKKLIWKYPQKKAYFASQIEELKK
jgi:hypothetical protein